MEDTARLLISCPDRSGIVAAVADFLFKHGANITDLDQHATDSSAGTFFMRLEFSSADPVATARAFETSFGTVAGRFQMDWRVSSAAHRRKMAIFVSRHDHALLEILWRAARGELPAEVTAVISNHPDLADAVGSFGIPFHCIPVAAETKTEAEQAALALLAPDIDLIVLARYMRVLSGSFVARFQGRIINIHHSFLPAFAGANPYQQAYEKGVKLIGATAHYVTAELDEGPIIEQDIGRVTHRHDVHELRRMGRDLERQVLARAVLWHLEDRIILDGNKTIVFA